MDINQDQSQENSHYDEEVAPQGLHTANSAAPFMGNPSDVMDSSYSPVRDETEFQQDVQNSNMNQAQQQNSTRTQQDTTQLPPQEQMGHQQPLVIAENFDQQEHLQGGGSHQDGLNPANTSMGDQERQYLQQNTSAGEASRMVGATLVVEEASTSSQQGIGGSGNYTTGGVAGQENHQDDDDDRDLAVFGDETDINNAQNNFPHQGGQQPSASAQRRNKQSLRQSPVEEQEEVDGMNAHGQPHDAPSFHPHQQNNTLLGTSSATTSGPSSQHQNQLRAGRQDLQKRSVLEQVRAGTSTSVLEQVGPCFQEHTFYVRTEQGNSRSSPAILLSSCRGIFHRVFVSQVHTWEDVFSALPGAADVFDAVRARSGVPANHLPRLRRQGGPIYMVVKTSGESQSGERLRDCYKNASSRLGAGREPLHPDDKIDTTLEDDMFPVIRVSLEQFREIVHSRKMPTGAPRYRWFFDLELEKGERSRELLRLATEFVKWYGSAAAQGASSSRGAGV
ncbi:unnamed protein product [Amoebophrya sp. A120]|nr:unnamed protein product [Amoebophrya sp. A120]|eukprot:GSA120T00025851001.1